MTPDEFFEKWLSAWPWCGCGQEPRHIRHGNDGKPRVLPGYTEAVERSGPEPRPTTAPASEKEET